MWALFGRRILGQYPAALSSPGPFVLLLNQMGGVAKLQGDKTVEERIGT